MYFQIVSMVIIAIAELISHKFQNLFLLCFQKLLTLCGLLLFFHEIWVSKGEMMKKVKIFKKN